MACMPIFLIGLFNALNETNAMKKILIFCALFICVCTAYAQTEAMDSKWVDKAGKREQSGTNEENDFSGTSIALKNRRIVFAHLPQLSKSAIVTITNNEGDMIKQAKVNTTDNTVDIRSLDKGTYFVNLEYKNERKKGFVLNL